MAGMQAEALHMFAARCPDHAQLPARSALSQTYGRRPLKQKRTSRGMAMNIGGTHAHHALRCTGFKRHSGTPARKRPQVAVKANVDEGAAPVLWSSEPPREVVVATPPGVPAGHRPPADFSDILPVRRGTDAQEQVQEGSEAGQATTSAEGRKEGYPSLLPADKWPTAAKWLYTPRDGVPLVRRTVNYSQLLQDVRLGKVKHVGFFSLKDKFFKTSDVPERDGSCLVVYHDDSVALAVIPSYDIRTLLAMETHGVTQSVLSSQLAPSLYNPPAIADRVTARFLGALPFIALGLAYGATQLAAWIKGDLDDRNKIRRAEIRREREQRQQEEADEKVMAVETLAKMGWSVEDIVNEVQRLELPYEMAYIVRMVKKYEDQPSLVGQGIQYEYNTEAAQQAAALEAAKKEKKAVSEGADDFAKAESMLKMKTVKITGVASGEVAAPGGDELDPETQAMKIRMRKVQRQMKGVKLQYTDERILFTDVAGIGDAKVELMEVVDFFTKPDIFKKSGARVPKGVLLCGPPGTGKTLLARAVAGEAGVPFLSLNASEFVEMFVGVGASRVRDLFAQARALSPAIIFIDEIDAVGRIRGGAMGNDERDQTLNQMLSEMDGFNAEAGVIVMGATNRLDVLDPALVRPGRFDRIVYVDRPDFDGRIEILKVHLRWDDPELCRGAADINFAEVSFNTARFSGAALANLVNSAATFAAQDGRELITTRDLEDALEYERLGPKRRPYSDDRRRRLAIQEGATALVCTLMPAIEPVQEVTIVPREKYPLGHTVLKSNEQRERTQLFTRRYMEEQLLCVLAGRAAEELIYGVDEISTINQRRLVMARRIVTKMLVYGGMSDDPAIDGRSFTVPMHRGGRNLKQIVPDRVTNATVRVVDTEMDRMLNDAYAQCKALIQRNRAALDAIVVELMEGPTNSMEGPAIQDLVARLGNKEDLARRAAEVAVFM